MFPAGDHAGGMYPARRKAGSTYLGSILISPLQDQVAILVFADAHFPGYADWLCGGFNRVFPDFTVLECTVDLPINFGAFGCGFPLADTAQLFAVRCFENGHGIGPVPGY